MWGLSLRPSEKQPFIQTVIPRERKGDWEPDRQTTTITTSTMSSPGHYIPVFLLLTIFFLISGGCAVSPFNEWEAESEPLSEETLNMPKRETIAYTTTEEDRPRILCGQALIHTLKEQCGPRGTFSPYHKRAVRELIRVARGLPSKFPFSSFQPFRHSRLCWCSNPLA